MLTLVLALSVGVTAVILLAMRGARIRAAAEVDADRKQRQIDALQGDINRAEKLERDVEAAKKVVLSGDLDLSDRLRDSGRSRPRRK